MITSSSFKGQKRSKPVASTSEIKIKPRVSAACPVDKPSLQIEPPPSLCSAPRPPPPAAPVGLFRFPGAAEADGPMRALAEDPFHFDWPHW